MTTSSAITVISHPLIDHKLTIARKKTTPSILFRQLVREITYLLGYELLRDLPLTTTSIETPLGPTQAPMIEGKKLVFVPILRAGLGLLGGMLDLVPSARVGHIGIYRDPDTLSAVRYYCKMPDDMPARLVVVLDPMLATGNSAISALDQLFDLGATQCKLLSLLATPQGAQAVHDRYPHVPIFTGALDEGLNEKGYIVPGLGDAGDRLYGTL